MFGFGFSALGFLPSVLALALYSMLPVLRNTITGLEGVDPAVTEAALGVGMTPRQSLSMVELPLALPVIMAGIRTAAVWVIGTATLSTPIGQTSLGNYIFTGLQTQNWVFVLFGCVAAALLALAVDQLLALMETGVARRARRRVAFGAVGLALPARRVASCRRWRRQSADYVVGAKPFSEQYVLAALIQQRLADSGLSAGRRDGLGSGVIFDALKADEIDVYVEYTGTIWANQMQRSDIKSRDEVLREVTAWLKEQARHHRGGRARLRERLRAGDVGAAREGARRALDCRPGAPRADADHRRRLRILRPAGMGGDPQRLRPQVQERAHHAAGVHVPGRGSGRGRRDRRLHQRRPHRAPRARRARRSEAGDPAL